MRICKNPECNNSLEGRHLNVCYCMSKCRNRAINLRQKSRVGNVCIDCGILICSVSTRCRLCMYKDPERSRKLREANTGCKHPKETKQKISKISKGRKHTEKTKQKMSEIATGRKHSKETKRKLSKIRVGKSNGPRTEETKQKLSASWTLEKREKQSKVIRDAWANGNYDGTQLVGSQSPHWKGGISFEPYGIEFNNSLRKQVRDRQNNRCLMCGKKCKSLDCHHIDYDKNNNVLGNLWGLCRSCHSKTNYNREYWKLELTKHVAKF